VEVDGAHQEVLHEAGSLSVVVRVVGLSDSADESKGEKDFKIWFSREEFELFCVLLAREYRKLKSAQFASLALCIRLFDTKNNLFSISCFHF